MSDKFPPKPDFLTQEEWDMQLQFRSLDVQRAFTKKQIDAIRSGGWAGNEKVQGASTCLMTTVGRKSGEERTSALIYYRRPQEKALYVVGSTAGLDQHPQWALNLDASRKALVELPGEKWDADVHHLSPAEKAQIWDELVKYFPMWGHFQKYCDRSFHVFRLSPKAQA